MKSNSTKLIDAINTREQLASDTSVSIAKRNKAKRQSIHFEKSLDAIVLDVQTACNELSRSMANHKVNKNLHGKPHKSKSNSYNVTLPKYHCSHCKTFITSFKTRIAITKKIENGMLGICPFCGKQVTNKKGFRKVKKSV